MEHARMYDPVNRRESDTSLPSSAAESKDSLGSFDSNSTLTGREIDDSIILSRIRKSLEQKEAFLRRPSQPTGWVTPDAPQPIKQREFYARPQKLQKPAWPPPPSSPPLAASPPPALVQAQSQEQTAKGEECSASVDSGTYSGYGELNGTTADRGRPKQDKGQFVATLSKIQETSPGVQNNVGAMNGDTAETKNENKEESSSSNNQESRVYRKWRPPRFTDDITPLLRIFDPNATVPARPEKKGEEEAGESAAEVEPDVQGHVQVKMVVSNGKPYT
ncbi:unnamed protein product, partial [Iphiclides podalirius]